MGWEINWNRKTCDYMSLSFKKRLATRKHFYHFSLEEGRELGHSLVLGCRDDWQTLGPGGQVLPDVLLKSHVHLLRRADCLGRKWEPLCAAKSLWPSWDIKTKLGCDSFGHPTSTAKKTKTPHHSHSHFVNESWHLNWEEYLCRVLFTGVGQFNCSSTKPSL